MQNAEQLKTKVAKQVLATAKLDNSLAKNGCNHKFFKNVTELKLIIQTF
jgi:hypothetical protein